MLNGICLSILGQYYPISINERLLNSSFIFEGTVIRSDPYYSQNEDIIYTSHTIEVSRIFWGYPILDCGTVEVITMGGDMGGEKLSIAHGLELRKGESGTFFCTYSDLELSTIDFYPETNPIKLQVIYGRQGFLRYNFDDINPRVTSVFEAYPSLPALYDSLSTYINLNDVICNPTIHKTDSIATAKKLKKQISYVKPNYPTQKRGDEGYKSALKELEKRIQINGIGNKTTNSGKLYYELNNGQITGNTPKYFEFDLTFRADDSLSYLEMAYARITYDTTMFGSNIYNNAKVWVTPHSMLQDTNTYFEPVTGDYLADNLDILIFTKSDYDSLTLPNLNRSKINLYPQKAVHIKMEITNCLSNSPLYFTGYPTILQYSYYTNTAYSQTNQTYNYADVELSDTEDGRCTPKINAIYPTIINAGIGDIFYIKGRNFGDNTQKGHVYMPSSDDNMTTLQLDNTDVLSWSDTLIQVRMPSIADSIPNPSGGFSFGRIGGGSVKVEDINSESDYGDLTVTYSLRNEYLGTDKTLVQLIDSFQTQYVWDIDTSVVNNPIFYAYVKKSIKDWRCLTHINFTEGSIVASDTTKPTYKDYRNVIKIGKTKTGAVGETYVWTAPCDSLSQKYAIDLDICFDRKWLDSLAFDSTGVVLPANKLDGYHIIQHELGHAGGLFHTNVEPSLMYYTDLPDSLRTLLATDAPALLGMGYMVSYSDTSTTGCTYLNSTPIYCGINAISPHIQINEYFNLYPNPTENELILENRLGFNLSKYELFVFNLLGQKQAISYHTHDLHTLELNVKLLQSGVYLLQVISPNGDLHTFKFVKL